MSNHNLLVQEPKTILYKFFLDTNCVPQIHKVLDPCRMIELLPHRLVVLDQYAFIHIPIIESLVSHVLVVSLRKTYLIYKPELFAA